MAVQSNKKVTCHACIREVYPILTSRCVMRHQEKYYNGFSLHVPDTQCPECGERGI